jgi:hypothetical protein
MPVIAQPINRIMSFFSKALVDFLNPKNIQNKMAVPITRIVVRANGLTKRGAICFTAITFVPKKKLASIIAMIALL